MTKKQWCGIFILILWFCAVAVVGSIVKGIPIWEGFMVMGVIIAFVGIPISGLSLLTD